MKIKSCWASRHEQQSKKVTYRWEKYLQIISKGLISRIYGNKKTRKQIQEWARCFFLYPASRARNLNTHFSKDLQRAHQEILNVTNHQRDANLNHSKIPPRICYGAHYQTEQKIASVVREQRGWKPGSLLLGTWQSTATTEEKTVIPEKLDQNCRMTQQRHFWICVLKNCNQSLKEILVHLCL